MDSMSKKDIRCRAKAIKKQEEKERKRKDREHYNSANELSKSCIEHLLTDFDWRDTYDNNSKIMKKVKKNELKNKWKKKLKKFIISIYSRKKSKNLKKIVNNKSSFQIRVWKNN